MITKKDYSYWIVPIYVNDKWEQEFLLINQKSINWSFWGFPKWHPENWEDGLVAAKRELFEEVGISDIDIDTNKNFEIKYSFKENWEEIQKTVKYRIWYTNKRNIVIQEEELNWYKWTDFDNMISLLTHNNTKDKIKKVFNKN